ncbi:prolyl-tRNA synthetase associated domain-containing protein [Psychromonas aquimarina]|uniref:prolyl-tRNA synthetase associated domain-containing protein n=1 Tax=Psychromonas aquimarina TaxID=444919 RepID=UPI0003FDBE3F|nr:prolyl-tRNA synthetase associated domain-containing protein [Psychromonas aquimarina]
MTDLITAKASLDTLLIQLNIRPVCYEHPPLATCDEADKLNLQRQGTRLKNLFLRDNYGRRHFLLLTTPEKKVDLKQLSKQMSISRLGFASAERLDKYLRVTPGSVSLLALINDSENRVELLMDDDIWRQQAFQCHPLVNTETYVLTKSESVEFLKATGHERSVIRASAWFVSL